MFEIYKKGQGTKARWVAAVALLALSAFGCSALHDRIYGTDWDKAHVLGLGFVNLHPSVLISAAAFIAAAGLVAAVVNHKRFVDYLINSEAELRKVSWPTRPELKRQTVVVMISMAFFGVFLFAADALFMALSRIMYGY